MIYLQWTLSTIPYLDILTMGRLSESNFSHQLSVLSVFVGCPETTPVSSHRADGAKKWFVAGSVLDPPARLARAIGDRGKLSLAHTDQSPPATRPQSTPEV